MFEESECMPALVKFEQSAVPPRLGPGEIHIWHARWEQVAGTPHDLVSALCPEERDRANKFRFKEDRDRYAMSRGILRKILGDYLAVSPVKLQFHYGPHGKPYLAENPLPHRIHFNVSQSSDLVLFAFSADHEIGIDVEHIRTDYDFEAIARRFLLPAEFAKLTLMPTDARLSEFFRLWTRMESYAKARGVGISLLDDLKTFSQGQDGAPQTATNAHTEMSNWKITDFIPESGYVASIAAAFSPSLLMHWKYPIVSRW
jgi:4'-phosphopantetheinyl transferase